MGHREIAFIAGSADSPTGAERLAGCIAECRVRWFKNAFTSWFAKRYQVDMSQALVEDVTAYEHFNAFFTRALKDGARPLDQTPGAVLSPADGAVSQLGPIEHGRVFQAKGHSYSVLELVGGDPAVAAQFMGGEFATIYLSPKDYHRVHMPLAGTLREMIYVPGRLFSVNQTTAENVPELFARNERAVCIFDTERGPEYLRTYPAVVAAVRHFFEAGKPVAAICHAAQLLAGAGVLKGRTCSAYPACRAEVELAGGTYADIAVDKAHTDGNLVSAPAWPAHPDWIAQFLVVLGTRISH